MEKYIRVHYRNRVRYALVEGEWLHLMDAGNFPDIRRSGQKVPISEIDEILSPLPRGRILGIGRNYMRPEFTEKDIPIVPKVFLKAESSVILDGEDIVLTPMNRDVICEPEIAFLIGKTGARIPLEQAMDYVAGYTVINDVTDRALLQEDGGEWTRGKSMDTFLPVGREIVTGINPFHLAVYCEINGEKKSEGNTGDMIFDIPHLIHFISHFMKLKAGDLILTGTPRGVPVCAGDRVKIVVEDVGKVENTVRFDDTEWCLQQ